MFQHFLGTRDRLIYYGIGSRIDATLRTEHAQGSAQNRSCRKTNNLTVDPNILQGHNQLPVPFRSKRFDPAPSQYSISLSALPLHRSILCPRCAMDTYQLNFAGLLATCAVLFVVQRRAAQEEPATSSPKKTVKAKEVDLAEASQWPFLTVFALVMGSDWLQVGT